MRNWNPSSDLLHLTGNLDCLNMAKCKAVDLTALFQECDQTTYSVIQSVILRSFNELIAIEHAIVQRFNFKCKFGQMDQFIYNNIAVVWERFILI